MRQSTEIKRWLAEERPEGAKGDDRAALMITRLFDLRSTTPLDRDYARGDLADAGLWRR